MQEPAFGLKQSNSSIPAIIELKKATQSDAPQLELELELSLLA